MKDQKSSSEFSDSTHSHIAEDRSEFSLFVLASIILKRTKFIAYTMGIVIVFSIIVLFLLPNVYTSTASILPSSSPDKLGDLKSLAGIGSRRMDLENTSALFPPILKSLHIASALLSEEYSFHVDGTVMTLTLQEYFGVDDFDLLLLQLSNISLFSTDKKTDVIRLSVETKYPAFSQALIAKYLFELENYNLHKRRSSAKESEGYLAKQLGVIKEELAAAENERERFQSENSNWHISSNSKIIKTLSRLEREVEIKSSIYLFLTEEHERAKFDAQKDIPIIQILDSPSLPTRKSGPHRTLILLLVTVISAFMVVFMVIVYESVKKHAGEQEKELLDEIKNDLQVAFPTISRFALRKKIH